MSVIYNRVLSLFTIKLLFWALLLINISLSDTIIFSTIDDKNVSVVPADRKRSQLPPVVSDKHSDSRTLLPVSDCFFCRKEFRPWYKSLNELCDAANLCGYDFIEIRCDNAFGDKEKRYSISTYFLYCNGTLKADSVVYMIKTEKNLKRVNILGPQLSINVQTAHAVQQGNTEVDRDIGLLRYMVDSLFASTFLNSGTNTIISELILPHAQLHLAGDQLFWDMREYDAMHSEHYLRPQIEYRIGSHIYHDVCDSLYQRTLTSGPRIEAVDISYFLNKSNIRCQIAADAGIDNVVLRSGNFFKSYRCNGEHTLNFSSSLILPDTLQLLTIEVTDLNARIAGTTVSVLDSLRNVTSIMKEKKEHYKGRIEWRKQHAINGVLHSIASFSGNPLSYCIDKLVSKRVSEFNQTKRTFIGKDTCRIFILPVNGRIVLPENPGTIVTGSFCCIPCPSVTSSKGHIVFNDIKMHNHALCGQKCIFTLDIPSSKQHTFPSWKCIVDTSGSGNESNPIFFICGKKSIKGEMFIVEHVPLLLKKPSKSIPFSVVFSSDRFKYDTISLQYAIKFLDKSTTAFFRTIPIKSLTSVAAEYNLLSDDQITHRFVVSKVKGMDFVATDEIITASKNIMRIDIFAYAHNSNVTFGAGSVWVN